MKSLNALAWRLKVPLEKIAAIADSASTYYRPFSKLAKGKSRVIDNPVDDLKWLQNKIFRGFVRDFPMPAHVQGGVKGRSAHTNAAFHLGARTLVRVDIASFFRSVTNRQVYGVWIKYFGCSPPVARLLTRITTYNGYLPQGASTSPGLSNLVLLDADKLILEAARWTGSTLVYTRYIDDLGISGDVPFFLVQNIATILSRHGFRIGRKKVEIMRAGKVSQEITGLAVDSGAVSVRRAKRDLIRAEVFSLQAEDPSKVKTRKRIGSVLGRIAFVELTNPGWARRHRKQMQAVGDIQPG